MFAGSDLRSLLALLRKDAHNQVPAKSRELLRTLKIMAQHEDPAAFFSFEDEAAGILRNTELPLASECLFEKLIGMLLCHVKTRREILRATHRVAS